MSQAFAREKRERSLPSPHQALVEQFPDNPFIHRLVVKAAALGIAFDRSPIENQWLYHHERRTLYVWEPDLAGESLTYLVVVLAHELGHAIDFDRHPHHRRAMRHLHYLEVPDEVEIAAFVQGFRILKELAVPISLDQYEQMIEPPIGKIVRERIESRHLCCLLSQNAG